MKIPTNYSEEKTIQIMKKVINRIAPKYVFYGYTVDDIKQESYIICIEALERYDEERPLENFLSVNLSNRLKNFIRDNYFTLNEDDKNDSKIKILQPAQLDYEFNIIDENEKFFVDDEMIDINEISNFIDRDLPSSLRMDYLKMINNIYINKFKKEEILNKINEILVENGYEERTIK